ncbi:hypothetical protein FrEUN1fDRAFT_4623 [Parafrankia sp. EUN1f]|nr:type I-E CRISPR-associated endoribonuclease Cas2 [Parafrankia sp. EUN1f]EFC82234.1 hypothetical protein FrEUN1fDRAFT_4623 [Parafrankia sp. EUN1f]
MSSLTVPITPDLRPACRAGNTDLETAPDRLWTLPTQRIGDGQAVMIEPASNEQGWAARTAGRDRYHPIDYDGLMLFASPRG